MGKNKEMIKSFFKVLKNDKTETNKILPKMYVKSIYDIDYNYLKKHKIKNLIFDIDNTILPVGLIKTDEKLINLFKNISKHFNIIVLSNNDKNRVIPVAKALEVGYMYKAGKPKKEAFDKALILLDAKKENIAMIGDQMLSDIKGANNYGIYSILVDPISTHHDIKTFTNRILQKIMIKKLEKRKIFKNKKYYRRDL